MLESKFFCFFCPNWRPNKHRIVLSKGRGKEREERSAKTCKEVRKTKKGKEKIRIKSRWRMKKNEKGTVRHLFGTWSEEAIIILKSIWTEHLYRHTLHIDSQKFSVCLWWDLNQVRGVTLVPCSLRQGEVLFPKIYFTKLLNFQVLSWTLLKITNHHASIFYCTLCLPQLHGDYRTFNEYIWASYTCSKTPERGGLNRGKFSSATLFNRCWVIRSYRAELREERSSGRVVLLISPEWLDLMSFDLG